MPYLLATWISPLASERLQFIVALTATMLAFAFVAIIVFIA